MLFDFNRALRRAIRNNQVFSGADDDHIRLIMANGTRRKFSDKELIVQEGQKAQSLYLIVDGRLEVRLEQPEDSTGIRRISDVTLNTLEPGHCFGEYSLIDRQTVSASVRAVSKGILFRISGDDFQTILAADVRLAKLIYKNLLEVLVRRLRKKDKELDQMLIMT